MLRHANAFRSISQVCSASASTSIGSEIDRIWPATWCIQPATLPACSIAGVRLRGRSGVHATAIQVKRHSSDDQNDEDIQHPGPPSATTQTTRMAEVFGPGAPWQGLGRDASFYHALLPGHLIYGAPRDHDRPRLALGGLDQDAELVELPHFNGQLLAIDKANRN